MIIEVQNNNSAFCCILTFDPAQNAIQGHAPEGSDSFQWQLGEEIRVGGNWLKNGTS